MVGGSLVAFPDVEIINPHFDLPFRMEGGKAAVVEQDSVDDITNCVVAILKYAKGSRLIDDRAEFGIRQPEFEMAPVDINSINDDIAEQEPRAQISISQEIDSVDALVTHIRVESWDTLDSQ